MNKSDPSSTKLSSPSSDLTHFTQPRTHGSVSISMLALIGSLAAACTCTSALAQAATANPVATTTPAAASSSSAPTQSASDLLAADPDVAAAVRISNAFKKVAAKVTPAVVNISATRGGEVLPSRPRNQQQVDPQDEFFRRFFGDGGGQPGGVPRGPQNGPMRTPQSTSFGSGVIVTSDGYILTNNHVIEGGREIKVTLSDGTDRIAKLIGTDANTDIAVLKVDGTGYAHATLGDSEQLSVGEWVLAIGNPFQFSQSVSSGVVSAKGRHMNNSGGPRAMYEDFIQTDAAVNPGNSGGPLVNLRGEVIGINSAIYTRSGGYMGISFAVPSNIASDVMEQLQTKGKVVSGWLGVDTQTLDPKTAESLGVPDKKGVVIAGVIDDSPAAAAGLKLEDVILEINGRPTPTPQALRSVVKLLGPGKTVPIKLVRAGKAETVNVILGDRVAADIKAGEIPADSNKLGLGLATLTPAVAKEKYRAPTLRGMIVVDVAENSRAAQIGIQNDDVLVQLSGRAITDVASFNAALQDAESRGSARLVVRRGSANLIATVSLRE